MMLLVTKAIPSLDRLRTPHLGRLVTPRHWTNLQGMARQKYLWAADNDAFNGFDNDRFMEMLTGVTGLPRCLFVAAPDEVGNAAQTLCLFSTWHDIIRTHRLPVALVAQDGLENFEIPWTAFDALFIGGGTEWKLSDGAAALVCEAKGRGCWVHMGRVNSQKRIRYAHMIGVDSIDGSGYSRFYDTHVPTALRLLEALDKEAP